MRKEKWLWFVIIVLSVSLVCTCYFLFRMTSHPQSSEDPGGQTKHPEELEETNHEEQNPEGNTEARQDRIVARIGDQKITFSQFQASAIEDYGTEIINRMLDRLAVQMEGEALHIKVQPQEVEDELRRMMRGYDSEEQYYEMMDDQLSLSKAELRADTYYKLMLQKIATYGINISDEEVDEYMAAYPDLYGTKPKLHLQQITFQTREKAEEAMAKLQQGEDFILVAREYAATESEGELGWVTRDDPSVEPEIMNAASGLEENEVSGIISLQGGGYAIVKVKGIKVPSEEEKQSMREQVRMELALSLVPSLQDTVKTLRQKYHAHIIDQRFQS